MQQRGPQDHQQSRRYDARSELFRAEQQAPGPTLVVTSIWFKRRGLKRQVSASYALLSSKKVYRSPRGLTEWLDAHDEAFIANELNGLSLEQHLPDRPSGERN